MKHLKFLVALWKANLQAALEFRSAFLTQVIFMMVNNGAYFMFWVLYFDKFKAVQGWTLQDMMLLYGIAATAWGTAAYFFGSFIISGYLTADGALRFAFAVFTGVCMFISFLTIIQSLSFWLGNTVALSQIALSALLTFSLYPSALFNASTKFVLLTIIPAALIGSVPAEFVRSFTWQSLSQISAGALIFVFLAVTIFRSGLRRYESGSAIQVEV